MSSRPFFLLPLCFVSALALNAYAALDPTAKVPEYKVCAVKVEAI